MVHALLWRGRTSDTEDVAQVVGHDRGPRPTVAAVGRIRFSHDAAPSRRGACIS